MPSILDVTINATGSLRQDLMMQLVLTLNVLDLDLCVRQYYSGTQDTALLYPDSIQKPVGTVNGCCTRRTGIDACWQQYCLILLSMHLVGRALLIRRQAQTTRYHLCLAPCCSATTPCCKRLQLSPNVS